MAEGGAQVPRIHVVSSEGGAVRRLTTGDFIEWRPSWARDGKWVYFVSDRGEGPKIWKVPAGGGSPVLVARGVWPVFESFDGKFVFYVGGPGQIWKTPAAGGEATLALKIGRRAAPLWTVSASGFYVLDPDAGGGPAIEFYPFGSSQSTHTTRLGGEPESYLWGVDGLSVSPDGRWIVYDHRDRYEGEIILVENFR
jgi:Tol biopolymer transport system component